MCSVIPFGPPSREFEDTKPGPFLGDSLGHHSQLGGFGRPCFPSILSRAVLPLPLLFTDAATQQGNRSTCAPASEAPSAPCPGFLPSDSSWEPQGANMDA